MQDERNAPDSGRMAVVDASNVANSAPSAVARLDYLRLLVARLEAAGLATIIVADATLLRRIDDRPGYLKLVEDGIIRVAPRGVEADAMILMLARQHDAVVVSNDRFDDWRKQYPDEVRRRVGFRIRNGSAELRGL